MSEELKTGTYCKKCYFSQEAKSITPCEFYIPDAISSSKKIDIIEEYNYISNYRCKYGVSKKAAEEILNNDPNFNIKEYSKQQISIKYAIFIRIKAGEDISIICENINKLQIAPQAVSMAFDPDYNMTDTKDICHNILGKSCDWKLHRFLLEKKDHEMLSTCISTDERLSKCQYIWILDYDTLLSSAANDSIIKINFIVNVDQPDISVLQSKLSSDYFNGIFLTIEALKGIWTHIDHDIGKAIESLFKDRIGYYD